MNWRGRIAAGQTVATPVSSLDFLPTCCRLANVDPPAGVALDGVDFLPAIDGKPISREKPLVWAYYNAINEARVAMRDGKWKVLAKLDGGRVPKLQNITADTLAKVRDAPLTDIEIYEITTDVGEQRDLAKSKPDLARKLHEKLRRNYRELVDHSHVW
jgi:arylsulfatase A